MNVQLNISHGRADDVEVYLSDPGGRKVELFTDVGSSGNNFTNTILDDEASTAITAGRTPFTGSYRPEGSLAAFDNRNSLGTWTLEVGDDKKGQRGTLNQWSITIVYEQASAGSSGQARAAKASSTLAQSAAPALPAVLVDRLFAAAARELVPSALHEFRHKRRRRSPTRAARGTTGPTWTCPAIAATGCPRRIAAWARVPVTATEVPLTISHLLRQSMWRSRTS